MNPFRQIFNRLQKSYRFRVWFSTLVPHLKTLGLLRTMKSFDREGAGDPWYHSKKDGGPFAHLFEEYSIDPENFIKEDHKYTIGFLIDGECRDRRTIPAVCDLLQIPFKLFDIRNPNLYEELRNPGCDGIMIRPIQVNNHIRNLFHEAVQVLETSGKIPIYPSVTELNVYEAKRTLANFLRYHNIPHPETVVFNSYTTALDFLEQAEYPLVFKTHIGAGGTGVEILENRKDAIKIAKRLFRKYYLRKGEHESRAGEWGYMILQQYIENVKEFRIIKIGDAWWGHQKWKDEEQLFLSGSGKKQWTPPPEQLLNFCYDLARKFDFTTMSFDIFVDGEGRFMVNELQTRFGHSDPSQMFVEGIPGKYHKKDGKWIFTPGFYNVHKSMLLIISDFNSLLHQKKTKDQANQ